MNWKKNSNLKYAKINIIIKLHIPPMDEHRLSNIIDIHETFLTKTNYITI